MALAIVMLAFLGASSAIAQVDADADQLGVYFDLDATEVRANAAAGEHFSAYVILTSPSVDEIQGIEFSYELAFVPGQETTVFRYRAEVPVGTVDWGNHGILAGEYAATFVTPLQAATGTVVVVQWEFSMVDAVPVQFYLGPSSIESVADGLPAYLHGEGARPLGVSSGDPGLPVAIVNGDCGVVFSQEWNFGSLKALFR